MATPNTGIPYVPEGTQDPAAGLNLALNTIDALLQTAVIDMDLTAPPGSPNDGDLHIVADSATGDWAGQDNNLARYVAEGGFWQFYAAGDDVHLILNKDDGALYVWDGAAWVAPIVGGSVSAAAVSFNNTASGLTATDVQEAIDEIAAGGGGSGDVTGPASSVAGNLALFTDTTGKEIEDGGTPGDMAFIDDAPSDGKLYGRKDAAWEEVPGGGGQDTGYATINVQTGTAYTLALPDAGALVTMSNVSANTLTVPPNSAVAFPVGTRVDIGQDGVGQTTVSAGSGVTIRTPETLKIRRQWGKATLIKRATNTWDIEGNLEAAP